MGNRTSFTQRPPGSPAEGQKQPSLAKVADEVLPVARPKFSPCGKRANFLGACFPHILKVGLALCVGMVFHLAVRAQCSNGFSTRSYDTSLNSNGFGNYTISVPQWSPDSGTLVSVKLLATVSSQYGFLLTNADNQSATYTLTLGQDDQITSSALAAPFTNVMSQQINTYPLAAGQQVAQSPFTFLNNHVSSDSITGNVAAFLGFGRVSLSYMSFTFTDLSTVNNATYSYSANINNTIKFSVQYLYCTGGNAVLPTTLTRFNAALTAPHISGLTWAAANETTGRTYDIQRSRDGQEFATINTVTAQGDANGADYSYSDNLEDSISGNIFYRLQIHDDAKLSFSAIQQVSVAASTMSATTGFHLFPNPATSYINIQTGVAANDWEVDIIAANGTVVQRTQALQSSTINIPFSSKLAAGTYFARLIGLHGQQGFSATFVVIPYN